MPVTVLRIDDRLIHGQVMFAWLSYSKAQVIMVADDLVVQDKMQQTMLKLVAPKTVKLVMKSIHDAALELKEETNENILLIMRNPESVLKLLEEGFAIDCINLGNISNNKSATERLHLLKNIHATMHDIDCLKAIVSKGVKVEIKLVPTDKPIDIMDLINSNKL